MRTIFVTLHIEYALFAPVRLHAGETSPANQKALLVAKEPAE